MFSTGAELHILIMNVEAFSTKKGVEFAERFLNSHKALMGIDESTTIKNPAAKRTKNISIFKTTYKIQKNTYRFTCNKITFRFIYTMLFFRSIIY